MALIAGVRRILLLTAETGWFIQPHPDQFRWVLVEVGLSTVFILAAVGDLVLLRKTSGTATSSDDSAAAPGASDGSESA